MTRTDAFTASAAFAALLTEADAMGLPVVENTWDVRIVIGDAEVTCDEDGDIVIHEGGASVAWAGGTLADLA